MMSEENQLITPVQQMASSCVGACLVSLFMTPLDVVKIRLQTQDMVRIRVHRASGGVLHYESSSY